MSLNHRNPGRRSSGSTDTKTASERRQTLKKDTIRRRDLLKLTGLLGIGVVIGNYGISHVRERKFTGRKILVTEHCVGCTGCVTVCPTLAITIAPGGIVASDDLCIRCGYCQTACATDGIRVLRPA